MHVTADLCGVFVFISTEQLNFLLVVEKKKRKELKMYL